MFTELNITESVFSLIKELKDLFYSLIECKHKKRDFR